MAKNNKQHSPYQNFLYKKHSKFKTPNSVINKLVKKATGSFLATKKRLVVGEVNEVYEISTKDGQAVIVRISRSKRPKFEAEKKAIKLALKAEVPAPKVLLVEKIPLKEERVSFCIEEKLEGKALDRLLDKIDESVLKSIVIEAGEILSKIHSIKVEAFGELYKARPYRSWEEYILKHEEKLERLKTASKNVGVDIASIDKAMEILKYHSQVYSKIKPQLLHGDFGTQHILVKNNHIVGIIDFENAMGGDPVMDFAWFDYFNGQTIPTDWLKEGYTNKSVFDSEFELKMKLYRLHMGLFLIDYYESEKNEQGMNYTKQKFKNELDNF